MSNFVRKEDVQKLFDQLLPYEKVDFLIENIEKEKIDHNTLEEMLDER